MAYRETVTLSPNSSNSGNLDAFVEGGTNAALWNEARRGTDRAALTKDFFGAGIYIVGHDIFQDSDIFVDVTAIEFDLSSIPVNANVKDVKFKLDTVGFADELSDPTDFLILKYDWGDSLTIADFLSMDTLNDPETYPVLGARNSQFLFSPPTFDASFLMTQAMIDYAKEQVALGGKVRLYLVNRESLKNIESDFYFRIRKGLSELSGVSLSDFKSYTFLSSEVSLEVIYEIPTT